MQTLTERDHKKILICLGLYLASLFASNTLGLKLMPFLFDTNLSVAVFYFPIVFLMTDVIGEVYGKKISKMFVRIGFMCTALFIGYSLLSLWMPWAEKSMWVKESYDTVFGVSWRIGIASLVAFLIAEFQDVFTFFFVRAKIGERFFWLRSFLSNLWSQLLDSAIFMVIAFAGIYTSDVIISSVITWWLYKVLMGLLYTPLSYWGIHILRNYGNGEEAKSQS
jgi:queuosine precursor transporter